MYFKHYYKNKNVKINIYNFDGFIYWMFVKNMPDTHQKFIRIYTNTDLF